MDAQPAGVRGAREDGLARLPKFQMVLAGDLGDGGWRNPEPLRYGAHLHQSVGV
jgi:hypothetical protein